MTGRPFYRVLFKDASQEILCVSCFDADHANASMAKQYRGAVNEWVSGSEAPRGLRCDACGRSLGPDEQVTRA